MVNKAKNLLFVNVNIVNPIPTGHGQNQPIYERHVTKSGRNRVKDLRVQKAKKVTLCLKFIYSEKATKFCGIFTIDLTGTK